MGGVSAEGGVILMPTWKRMLITGIQLSMTLITAGVIIGYGQLYPLLIDSGVYHSKCGNTPNSDVCDAQNSALSQLFTVGASVSIFIQAPSGIILDFLGPRITCWTGLALFIPGCFVFAFAEQMKSVNGYMIGFQLLAAGGPFVFISALPVSQLWPDRKALILMMINGVYGGGAFVFFLFSILYEHAHISLKYLFIGYGVVGVIFAVIAGFVWPRRGYASTPDPNRSLQDEEKRSAPTTKEILQKTLKDIRSVHFIYMALFVAFLVYKSNFFLSTYDIQFAYHMSSSQAAKYVNVFGVLLPGIGILAGPIGLIFDKFGVHAGLVMVIVLSTACSVCGLLVQSAQIFAAFQIVRMILFSIYFPMIYGIWAFAIMSFYGNLNFGALYGTIAICAGIVNLFATNPAGDYALRHHSYTFINLLFACIGAAFVIYPVIMLFVIIFRRKRSGYQPL